MRDVVVRGLVKEFGAARAVDGLDLHVGEGEFVTLLGPSGCGKTTTLRCVAGLELPTAGEISIGDEPVFSSAKGLFVPPDKRRVGMVFQSYALWPHMTVGANVGYPLRLAGTSRADIRSRVHDMLDRVGLADRQDRMATALSGGQQQRVALARAMVNRPTVMLFDEPLSNLDSQLRLSVREQIRALHDELGTTSLYVTHDQEEAMALSDRIVVMHAGRIEQAGTPRELYTAPATAFVADFMGFQNVLDGRVAGRDGGGFALAVDGTDLRIPVRGAAPGPDGTAAALAFRAAHVRPADPGEPAALSGRVASVAYLGSCARLRVDVGGTEVVAQLDEGRLARLGVLPAAGEQVELVLEPGHVVALPGRADLAGVS